MSHVLFACLDEVMLVADDQGTYHFKDLYDRVNMDEKWFHMTCDGKRYIVLDPLYATIAMMDK
jgi:hypothetical protein